MNDNVFRFYTQILLDFNESRPTLPVFSKNELITVCNESKDIFTQEQNQIDLKGNFIIIGDLHGHIFDLIKIFQKYGLPPTQNFIFLGDIVDRGDYSLSVVTLILVLKSKYPHNIYLLRGNHEFRSVCSVSGFLDEIKKIYKNEEEHNAIFDSFIDVFNSLPLAACINNQYYCVHGGIGPKFQKIVQLKNIVRPMNEIYGGIADEILWSDPSENIDLYRPSTRGVGYEFGCKAISNFLKENKFKLLIRAHQQIQNGYEYSLDNLVLTVFSASNYCGEFNNFAGIILIEEDAEKEKPIQLDRSNTSIAFENVIFLDSEERNFDVMRNKKRRGHSKSFRISSNKSSSSLPTFIDAKKKLHSHHSKSILHEKSASPTENHTDEVLLFPESEESINKIITDLNHNVDEVEIDPELDENRIHFDCHTSTKHKNSVGHKKSVQSLRLDLVLSSSLENWDNAPKSMSARTPNRGANLPFTIRSRKAGPISKKLNFS